MKDYFSNRDDKMKGCLTVTD